MRRCTHRMRSAADGAARGTDGRPRVRRLAILVWAPERSAGTEASK